MIKRIGHIHRTVCGNHKVTRVIEARFCTLAILVARDTIPRNCGHIAIYINFPDRMIASIRYINIPHSI
ncbi:hypothetical protein D3C86_1974650 [compost metagenome]